MGNVLRLKVITPSSMVVDEEVTKVFIRTVNGEIEFLKNHAPIIASTIPCITIFENASGERIRLFTSSGIINLKDNNLMFLTEAAEREGDIDLERALLSKKRAEDRLKEKEKYDETRARSALARSIMRINFKDPNL